MDRLDPRPSRRILLAGGLATGLAGCQIGGPTILPQVELPGLPGLTTNGWPVPGIDARQFLGRVSLLNVWASWCPYCRAEHEALMRLSADGRFPLVGLVFRDEPAKAVGYLRRSGNPYRAAALDTGELTQALRQRGVPSTYVVDRQARVVEAVRGGLDDGNVRDRVMPAVARSLASV